MAALTTERDGGMVDFDELTYPVAAGEKIFAGAGVVLNASGYAEPASTATGLKSLGRACRTIDNSSGLDGAKSVSCEVSNGTKGFWYVNDTVSPVTIVDLLGPVFWKDDQTVTSDDTGASEAGIALKLRGTEVLLMFPQ